MKFNYLFAVIMILIMGCKSVDQAYIADWEAWRQERLAKLKAPDGWPSVVGLYWLKEGRQWFGSSAEVNEMSWKKDMPSTIGRFDLEGDSVVCWVYPNLSVKINGIDTLRVRMISDTEGQKTVINWRNYYWYLIKRQDRYGIRLIDTLSEARFALKEIPHFPVRKVWRLEAKVLSPDPDQKVRYANVAGMNFNNPVKAILQFTWQDEFYKLLALDNGDGRYFVIFSDETTGESTYGGGRYIYPDIPETGDTTILDFNKAVNPPCVFTDYATCPLPPKENYLPFKVTAGEENLVTGVSNH